MGEDLQDVMRLLAWILGVMWRWKVGAEWQRAGHLQVQLWIPVPERGHGRSVWDSRRKDLWGGCVGAERDGGRME